VGFATLAFPSGWGVFLFSSKVPTFGIDSIAFPFSWDHGDPGRFLCGPLATFPAPSNACAVTVFPLFSLFPSNGIWELLPGAVHSSLGPIGAQPLTLDRHHCVELENFQTLSIKSVACSLLPPPIILGLLALLSIPPTSSYLSLWDLNILP